MRKILILAGLFTAFIIPTASTQAAGHWGKCPNSIEDAIRHASWRGITLKHLRRPMMCRYITRRGALTYWAFQHLGPVHFYSGAAAIHPFTCMLPPGYYYKCYDARITFLAGTYN